MPVKPPPMKLTCRQCGHSMVFVPRSDAFVVPNCEQCGDRQWEYAELSIFDRLNPKILFRQIFK